jgi:glutamyl-Q tRNA(Asp) synthetase
MTRGAGRFAPSPTGPLHLGSLLTATAAFLDARAHGHDWYVRFDDLDTDRNRPGAAADILHALEAHGLYWDGPVRFQHARLAAYEAALELLAERDRIFYCRCSRSEIGRNARYPGTCRGQLEPAPDCAVRFRIDPSIVAFDDLIQGPQRMDPGRAIGDFVIRRRDGIFAYALATAVDDGAGDITRVIRGRDLLPHTAAQLLVTDALGLPRPTYGHLPLIVNGAGQKLSKQTLARALDLERPVANLRHVLAALGNTAAAAEAGSCEELLRCAVSCWSLDDIPRHDVSEPS